MKLWSGSARCYNMGESSSGVNVGKKRKRVLTPNEEDLWGSSSGSNYLPQEDFSGDNEGNVSLDNDRDVNLGSAGETGSNTVRMRRGRGYLMRGRRGLRCARQQGMGQ